MQNTTTFSGGKIMNKTLFLSHRGESDDAPENTLASFALAMERDSDGIELDIRMTSDQQIVCVHDPSLERVANRNITVAEHTLQELCEVHPVPLISEALDVLLPGKFIQIELKGKPFELAELRKLVDKHLALGKLIGLSSFETETLELANEIFPDVSRVLLIDLEKHFGKFPSADEVVLFCHQHKFSGISFKADFRADKSFVDALRSQGLRVVAWGVDTDEKGLAMADAGVDALTCNHAVALRKKASGRR
jgi:glycerophosphoryl diester phosphodiesterase